MVPPLGPGLRPERNHAGAVLSWFFNHLDTEVAAGAPPAFDVTAGLRRLRAWLGDVG